MFGIFSNLFGGNTNKEAVQSAINKGALLVDVRTPAEFASGSVPGAINIPLDQVQEKMNSFKNKKSIVVFCRSGSRSNQAKTILEQNGINNVHNGGTWNQVAELVNK
jgi:phage shock protein E